MAHKDWPDGKSHSISYAQHLENLRAGAGNPLSLPAPPPGTYDPTIDYNAGAAQRGYDQTANDAQTQYEQGQQDYGLNLGNITTSRDRTLADLLTQRGDVQHQYGILGHQQAQSAAQHGITSQGLLGKSAQVRAGNEAHDIAPIDLASSRASQDFTTNKTVLDLNNARTFGGFNGQTLTNPLTGQPEFGSLLTSLTRAGGENTAYQTALQGQAASQAAANGYVSPLTRPYNSGVAIGRTPLTHQQYQQGLLLDALLGGRPRSAAGL